MRTRILLALLLGTALVATLPWGVKAQTGRGPAVDCILTTTAATSTLIAGCEHVAPGNSIYITDISVYGDAVTAAANPATIQSGTGSTCGTGTKIHYYCQHAVTAGCEAHFETPIRALTEGAVCLLDATVGTKFVAVKGYVGPK